MRPWTLLRAPSPTTTGETDRDAPGADRRAPRRRRTAITATATAAALGLLGAAAALGAAPGAVAGPRPDGTATVPMGYRVTPAGSQMQLGDLPLTSALSPDGRTLVAVNAGQGTQSVQVVDTRTGQVVQTIPYVSSGTTKESVYGGAAFSPDGKRLFVTGGGQNVVHTYDVALGRLTETAPLTPPSLTAPDGTTLNPFPAGVAVTPDGARLVVSDQLTDAVTLVDLATGALATTGVGHRPYGVTLSADGSTAYVANQGEQSVSVVDVSGAAPVERSKIEVGTHPNRSVLSPDGATLYVANGDSDSISVLDTASSSVTRTLSLAPYKGAPVGSNPDALALSKDAGTLYVANSGNNDVAVLDLARSSGSPVVGMIPTGWYPTSLHVAGGNLWVTNGKGLGAGPNDGPGRPDPTQPGRVAEDQYIGSMMRGTLSTVPLPDAEQLAAYSEQVVANNGFDERSAVRVPTGAPPGAIPRRVGDPSPIKHVIYVVKENRTYDQVLGSLGKGNGDPSLNLFGDDSAPNTRALSRQFTTFDNFYADAEISANGWNWVTAANSNSFAEQQWPSNYSGRGGIYSSESGDPALSPGAMPSDAHIWDQLADADVSFRNYGFFTDFTSRPPNVTAVDPVLDAATNRDFVGYDMSCPDSSGTFEPMKEDCGPGRVDTWLEDFRADEAVGTMPAMQFVRLPTDHTSGTRPGTPTPQAYVADNDYALGRLVDAVSHSEFWKDTAIFVTEDDAQNGPDHVDAHRTIALAISPYTQTGRVDSTFYSTSSMLRTMELILGVGPLTQFDTYATPMVSAVTRAPNTAQYDARTPRQSFAVQNAADAPLAAESSAQDLSREDRADEQVMNRATWKSVMGRDAVMPGIQHHVIAGGSATDGDG